MDRKLKNQDSRISRTVNDASHLNSIDINEATVEELEMLNGIGRAKAEAIVDDRKRTGLFANIADITRINGIGKGVLDQNRALLVCRCPSNQNCTASIAPSHSSNRRRETRSSSVVAEMTARRQCKFKRTAPLSNVQPSTPNVVHCRTRSGLNYVAATSSNDKAVNSSLVSITAHNPVAELPSTSERQLPILDVIKTPNDVRASLQPLFDGCRRHTSSLNAGETLDCVGELELPGTSETVNGRSFRSRGVTVRSTATPNCNGNVHVFVSSDTCSNGHHDLLDNDCNADNVSSGQSGTDSCVDCTESCTSPKKSILDDPVKNSAMKRKADNLYGSCCCDKPILSACDCNTNCEASDGLYSLLTDSSVSAPKKQRIPSRKNPPALLSAWLHTFQKWSHAERLMALDTLVESCSPTQVRHIMQVIEPQFQRDFISFLPKELALYVLSFLEPRDLIRASQTCRYWRTLAEDNLLWREKCQEEGLSESFVFGHRFNSRRPVRPRCNVADRNGMTQWKYIYKRQRQIENNWSHGSLRAQKVLKGHDDHVITCLEFNGSKVVSGSDDNTLKVWSAVTGKCLRTLVGHTGGVWSSQMSGDMVISGSTDRTLKVWNIDTGKCVFTLYGHTSTVRCMHLHGNRLVSGSRDATLRIWDIDSGHCLRVLIGHVAAVRCVQFDGRRVVSGAYDYMVKIWDPQTETCLQTLAGHTNRVYSLQFDSVHIVSGSLDTSIRVWNAETGACLHTLIGHQSLTSGMELRDNILVSGNADSTVKVWNITTGQCLQTLQGANKHQSAVTCLQFNRRFVVTSSDDGTVKIWDLRSGDFLRNLVALDSGGSGGVVWRIRCSNTTLVCAVGSRNGTEETKLLVLDFDVSDEESNAIAIVAD